MQTEAERPTSILSRQNLHSDRYARKQQISGSANPTRSFCASRPRLASLLLLLARLLKILLPLSLLLLHIFIRIDSSTRPRSAIVWSFYTFTLIGEGGLDLRKELDDSVELLRR